MLFIAFDYICLILIDLFLNIETIFNFLIILEQLIGCISSSKKYKIGMK